ncbi:MAG: hypothetical protein AUK54_04570 [Helicobacteraceae bacterium CG2_30_36_10]|nr:MAG: hypothetical protein AUK54_04570 [Helicobacteraceae bacterium CG2_30_36_10]
MGEPRLKDIDDYDTLKGGKKRVVWAVILAGLLIGAIYKIAYNVYDNNDAIKIEDTIQKVPMK